MAAILRRGGKGQPYARLKTLNAGNMNRGSKQRGTSLRNRRDMAYFGVCPFPGVQLASCPLGGYVSKTLASGNGDGTQRLNPDWREIAQRAEKETDPRKLIRLVKALCDRLEELHATKRSKE